MKWFRRSPNVTFTWKSWAGHSRSVVAHHVLFKSGHVVFVTQARVLVLAVDNANIHELKIQSREFEGVNT